MRRSPDCRISQTGHVRRDTVHEARNAARLSNRQRCEAARGGPSLCQGRTRRGVWCARRRVLYSHPGARGPASLAGKAGQPRVRQLARGGLSVLEPDDRPLADQRPDHGRGGGRLAGDPRHAGGRRAALPRQRDALVPVLARCCRRIPGGGQAANWTRRPTSCRWR
jgi:hypothetical protein